MSKPAAPPNCTYTHSYHISYVATVNYTYTHSYHISYVATVGILISNIS